MSRSLYIAASGMAAQQTRLDNIANNIANVGTTAFKKSNAAFEDLLYQELDTVASPDAGIMAELGGGVRLSALERDHTQGSLKETGNPLHLAIEGKGFFAVESAAGERLYTRDGTFTRSADGQMITAGGLRVAGDIQFPEDTQRVRIDADGTVRATMAGDDGTEVILGELELVTVDSPNALKSMGRNLYAATPESGEPRRWEAGVDGQVAQGMLETSNVDVAVELITLIEAQRAYELNSKVVQATDEAMQVAANLKR
jgi:flagellar basal-body rod protein FlgG